MQTYFKNSLFASFVLRTELKLKTIFYLTFIRFYEPYPTPSVDARLLYCDKNNLNVASEIPYCNSFSGNQLALLFDWYNNVSNNRLLEDSCTLLKRNYTVLFFAIFKTYTYKHKYLIICVWYESKNFLVGCLFFVSGW